jgi:hypothetical protein
MEDAADNKSKRQAMEGAICKEWLICCWETAKNTGYDASHEPRQTRSLCFLFSHFDFVGFFVEIFCLRLFQTLENRFSDTLSAQYQSVDHHSAETERRPI